MGATIAPDIPKPMIEIGELPVLEREIYCFRNQGSTDIILMVGLWSQYYYGLLR